MSVTIETSFMKQTFDHRVNLVNGMNDVGDNSGTRKTHFFNRLREEKTAGTLISNYNPVFVDNVTNITNFVINDGDVIILDEANFKPSLIHKLYEDLKRKDAYLILIGRLTSNINCNFEAIYYLTEFSEDKVTLNRVVDFQSLPNHLPGSVDTSYQSTATKSSSNIKCMNSFNK